MLCRNQFLARRLGYLRVELEAEVIAPCAPTRPARPSISSPVRGSSEAFEAARSVSSSSSYMNEKLGAAYVRHDAPE